MGLLIQHNADLIGASFDSAYVRLYSLTATTHAESDGTLVRGPLYGQFMIYVNQNARIAKRDPIGSVTVSIPFADVKWGESLMPQLWAALKAKAANYGNGTDVLGD